MQELHPQNSAFLVLGRREVAVATAHHNVLFVRNMGSVKRGFEFVGLGRIVGAVVVAVDDERGRQAGQFRTGICSDLL